MQWAGVDSDTCAATSMTAAPESDAFGVAARGVRGAQQNKRNAHPASDDCHALCNCACLASDLET